jgi:hypothetical protein
MLEVSIVDAKVGKSSWIYKINSHHGGGGRGGNGGGGDSPIACGSAAEGTNDNSERADSIESWFHNRRLSLPYNLDRFFLFSLALSTGDRFGRS